MNERKKTMIEKQLNAKATTFIPAGSNTSRKNESKNHHHQRKHVSETSKIGNDHVENEMIDETNMNENEIIDDDDNASYTESFERASADLEMLLAAYPDEIQLGCGYDEIQESESVPPPKCFPLIFTLHLMVQNEEQKFDATITMELPKGYPTSRSLEVVSYRSLPSMKKEIIEQVVASVKNEASESLNTYGGEECGLSCCAVAIETWTTLIESEQQSAHEVLQGEDGGGIYRNDNGNGNGNENHNDEDINWITSENTLVDRKSVFQAHLCIVSSEEMVTRAVNKLIGGSTKIQRATHNMFAYRFTEVLPNGKTILKHDNDDDGEDAAGSRLAQLLHMRKEDGVLILVSRWYGGVHLGPKRFAHITNVARDLLVECHNNGILSKQLE